MSKSEISAAKHTPGPWNLQRNVTSYRTGATSLQARGATDDLIATFPGCDRDAANARLIAAAPELLEALQGFIDCWDAYAVPVKEIEKARAAIAKATGSAQ